MEDRRRGMGRDISLRDRGGLGVGDGWWAIGEEERIRKSRRKRGLNHMVEEAG